MKLYEIDQQIENIVSQCGEEPTVEQLAMLDSLDGEKCDKIDSICAVIKNTAALFEALKNERDNKAKRMQHCLNKIKWLKNYLRASLQGKKYKSAVADVSYRTTERLNVINIGQVPEKYKKVSTNTSVDKNKIKEDMKNNIPVTGVILEENRNIIIK